MDNNIADILQDITNKIIELEKNGTKDTTARNQYLNHLICYIKGEISKLNHLIVEIENLIKDNDDLVVQE
jgi:hypothetical protein